MRLKRREHPDCGPAHHPREVLEGLLPEEQENVEFFEVGGSRLQQQDRLPREVHLKIAGKYSLIQGQLQQDHECCQDIESLDLLPRDQDQCSRYQYPGHLPVSVQPYQSQGQVRRGQELGL